MTESHREPQDSARSRPDEDVGTTPTRSAKQGGRGRWLTLAMALGALATVLAVNVVLILASPARMHIQHAASVSVGSPSSISASPPATQSAPIPLSRAKHLAEPELKPSDELRLPKPLMRTPFDTVFEAAARSCSTSSVDGLSRQIISQSRCVDASAFVPLLTRSNIVAAPHVFLYFDRAARDDLAAVLEEHPDQTMTINSALRTVAQQYLVRRWSEQRRCGVQLATAPGDSNHETGLALDIRETRRWKRPLEAHGFRWLGAKDRVHFDYKRKPASSHAKVDVAAFQQLWNLNHPNDPVPETGQYGAATEERLKKAPPNGFERGPECEKPPVVLRGGGGGSSRTHAR